MLNLEQQIFRQLEKSSNILVVFPSTSPETPGGGDAVASALALYLFFIKMGKETDLAGCPPPGRVAPLSFLPSYTDIQADLKNLRRFIVSVDISQAKVHNIRYTVDGERLNFIISPAEGWFKPEDVSARAGEFKYDLIVTVGTTDLEALGKIYDDNIEFFYKTTIVNIDHQAANEEFGQINYVDLNAVATAEILFYLLKNYRPDFLTEDITTCLLAGIIQQTKNFKTANLTPRTLLTTSELIDRGARREEIVDHLYRSRDLISLKLWGRILNNLKTEKNDTLLWSTLSTEDFRTTSSSPIRLREIVDELIANVPSAKLIVILYEDGSSQTRASLYSLKNINALEIVSEYEPTGSSKAAQITIKNGLKSAADELIGRLKNRLDKLAS